MLSTVQAAALLGVTPAGFRSQMVQARRGGVDARVSGPDARTPLWDEAVLRVWMVSRPAETRLASLRAERNALRATLRKVRAIAVARPPAWDATLDEIVALIDAAPNGAFPST